MLRGVGDDDHAVRRRGDDLLAQKRAATALDEAKLRVELVGAIDRQVEGRGFLEGGERNAEGGCLGLGRLGGRDAEHLEAGADPRPQEVDEMARRRARAEAEAHARLDQLQGLFRGAALGGICGVDRHRAVLVSGRPERCVGDSFSAGKRQMGGSSDKARRFV